MQESAADWLTYDRWFILRVHHCTVRGIHRAGSWMEGHENAGALCTSYFLVIGVVVSGTMSRGDCGNGNDDKQKIYRNRIPSRCRQSASGRRRMRRKKRRGRSALRRST